MSCVGCGDVTAVMYELAWLARRTTRRPRVRPGGLSAASTVGGRAAEFLDFLTDGQVAAYGRFDGVPSWADLQRFFILDAADRDLIGDRRGDHNRLGFVLQATTVRYVGVFLEDPVDVPWQVVEYLAAQLGIEDPSCAKRYTDRPKTAYEHAWEIRVAYGFRAFEDALGEDFGRFLDGRAWTHAEGPAALFEQAVGWLRRHRVLLPGVTVLTRLVNAVRDAAADRMHARLAAAVEEFDPMLPGRLRASLRVPDGSRFSELERWRRAPTRVSGPGLVKALDRAADLAGLRVREVDCSAVPANRMTALARYGLASTATALLGLAEPRRTATLLAMTRHLDAAAIDDAHGYVWDHAPISERPMITLPLAVTSRRNRSAKVATSTSAAVATPSCSIVGKRVPASSATACNQSVHPEGPLMNVRILIDGAGRPAPMNAVCSFPAMFVSVPARRKASVIHWQQLS